MQTKIITLPVEIKVEYTDELVLEDALESIKDDISFHCNRSTFDGNGFSYEVNEVGDDVQDRLDKDLVFES